MQDAHWLAGLALAMAATGLVSGTLAGLLGVGGGIVIVPVLFNVFPLFSIPESVQMKLAVGTSLATIVPTLLWAPLTNRFVVVAMLSILWMGCIGFLDDYLKIVQGKSRGLVAKWKLAGQVSFGVLLGLFLAAPSVVHAQRRPGHPGRCASMCWPATAGFAAGGYGANLKPT